MMPNPVEVRLLAAEIAAVFERRNAELAEALSALGVVTKEIIGMAFDNDHDRTLMGDRFAAQLLAGVAVHNAKQLRGAKHAKQSAD